MYSILSTYHFIRKNSLDRLEKKVRIKLKFSKLIDFYGGPLSLNSEKQLFAAQTYFCSSIRSRFSGKNKSIYIGEYSGGVIMEEKTRLTP